MNKNLQKINIEDCLFYDAEFVSANEDLAIDSQEYDLFQYRNRNKETGEFLEPAELKELYKQKAALTLGFNRIVTIGVGYVKDGQVRIKALQGTESELLQEFAKITNHFKYFVSYNGINFDAPSIVALSNKYFSVADLISDGFNPSQKKPWELKQHVDLIEVIRASYYQGLSFELACYLYDIPSPKQKLQGSEVTKTYYSKGIEPILDYVSEDVFALVNLFQAVRWEPRFEDYVDSTENLKPKSIIEQLHTVKELTKPIQEQLKERISNVKVTNKDKKILEDMLFSLIVRSDFDAKDTAQDIKRKQEEVEQFIGELSTTHT